VESWPRITSKRLSADVRAVAQGTFDFATLEPLLERFGLGRNRMICFPGSGGESG
jgi:hypothetical protein